ncbi:MAG: tripartite tricarboxylate transporter permease [Candidatus Dormibacteria bacterium]
MNLVVVLGQAAEHLFSPVGLLCLVAGTVTGILVGALPGIGPLSGIALLLPLSFFLPPAEALIFYTTLYQAAEYGGSITAIAVSTPGSPNSAAIILDGYQLNRAGRAAKAFAYSLWSATFGGVITTILLILVTPLVATWALLLGPPEYAALGILGLTAIAFLVGGAPRRGMIGVGIGVLIGTIGLDSVTGVPRFDFGNVLLSGGIPLAPMLIGLFAIPEALRMLVGDQAASQPVAQQRGRVWLSLREFRSVFKPASLGVVIGFFTGLLPGMAGSVPPFLSYNVAKATSRHPEQFGKGSPEGIAAPEATNAAVMHATLIPTFALGIPGTPTSAIILGAMLIAGLTPGPELLARDPVTVYTVFLGLFVGTGLLWVLGMVTTNAWARMISLPAPVIGVAIIVLCAVGAYANRGTIFDVGVLVVFGFVGLAARRFGYSAATLVLGAILGPIIERNLRLSLILSSGNPITFVDHPISLALLLGAVGIMGAVLWSKRPRRPAGEGWPARVDPEAETEADAGAEVPGAGAEAPDLGAQDRPADRRETVAAAVVEHGGTPYATRPDRRAS